MTFKECCSLIKSDYLRCCEYDNVRRFGGAITKLFGNESFMITFWFRLGSYLRSKKNLFAVFGLILIKLIFKWNKYLTGIQLLVGTDIGPGLKFVHYGCIVIGGDVKIGEAVTIFQGVTIGKVFGGKKVGAPTIGNHVVIFAGAKIVGNIHIGNHAVIGANAVVTDDVPDYAVVGGVPAKVISKDSRKCFNEQWSKRFSLYKD